MAGKKKEMHRVQSYNGSQNIWGIANFNPKRCEGEDDLSIKKHMEVLAQQNQLMPNIRDKLAIKLSMDKTFPERRDFILKEIRKIVEIKEEYPLLFTYDQVLNFGYA